MKRLFSYCISIDDGAAPNPFWNVCTLVICKPVIRRVAKVGDWVVATGSVKHGLDNQVIYAMEVTEVMSMKGYDEFCRTELPGKIPNWRSRSYKARVGDCIYDFTNNPPSIRKSVHNEGNRATDLGGQKALLSTNFYYFGEKGEILPERLLKIVKQGQGHKSTSNRPYFESFTAWIEGFGLRKNKVWGEPYLRELFMREGDILLKCAQSHEEEAEADELLDND